MSKQIVAIGTSQEIAAHFASKGVALSQKTAHSVQTLSDTEDNVGCYLLHWDSAGTDLERIVSMLQAGNKERRTVPLYILHTGKADRKLETLSKNTKIAGIFNIPSELFKLDMVVYDVIHSERESQSMSEQKLENPFQPQRKYSVSDVLSRCANALIEAKPASESSDQKIFFFCESTELLKQAKDAFARISVPNITFFSAAEILLESIITDAPHQLMIFSDVPTKTTMAILEKIGLNRKLPTFGIQLLFPGEQSRAVFLRAASTVLFDQVAMAALTPKDLRSALDQLRKAQETQTPRTLIASIRTLISDANFAEHAKSIEDQLAVLAKIPGKERWAARESVFVLLAQGQLEAGIAAFKKYQKEHFCDLEMWLELKAAAQKNNLNIDQCIDGAIKAVTTTGFATEYEHRLLIKTLEDHGNASAIKKYIDARIGNQPHDAALKLAFAAFSGAVNDSSSELQWVLDLLTQSPTDPGLILRCGRALSKLGDFDSAARTFGFGAKAAPTKRLIFELKQVESLIGGNRMMKAEERIQVLKKDFPSDPRITRLAQRIGKHFATAASSSKLMVASE